jgi:predicted nucleic acid-binding protein
MAVLLDTNILLLLLQPHHAHSPLAERALNILRKRNEVLNLTAQNLVEFWAATTRPVDENENGLGFTTGQAAAEVDALMRSSGYSFCWRCLVAAYRVSGKNTHDVRLGAAMIVHGVSNILMFNTKDFTRYAEIVVVDPKTFA